MQYCTSTARVLCACVVCDCVLPCSSQPLGLSRFTIAGAPNHVARAPARSFLRAAGFTDADFFKKPFVSLSVPWTTGQPCNLHHRELGDLLEAELEAAGAKAFDVEPTFLEHGIAVPNAALLARAVAPLLGG